MEIPITGATSAPEVESEKAPAFLVGIRHFIVHDLIKLKNGPATVDLGLEELEISGVVRDVVSTLASEYRSRASKSHGRFKDDSDNAPVPVRVRSYLAQGIGFVEFSQALMATLRDRAGRVPGATCGHVLIAHVDEPKRGEALLIAILTDETGAAVTSWKDLAESKHLNMKGFRYAGRIDLTGLRAGADRYVSFLRGATNKVSEYFKDFLGCDTTIVERHETTKLTDVLKKFAHENFLEDVARTAFLREANNFCIELARIGEGFEPELFANRMFPSAPSKLIEALEDPEVKLSSGFVPHRGGLRGLVKFTGAVPGRWKVEFDREALTSGDITFDPVQKSITVKNLPSKEGLNKSLV